VLKGACRRKPPALEENQGRVPVSVIKPTQTPCHKMYVSVNILFLFVSNTQFCDITVYMKLWLLSFDYGKYSGGHATVLAETLDRAKELAREGTPEIVFTRSSELPMDKEGIVYFDDGDY